MTMRTHHYGFRGTKGTDVHGHNLLFPSLLGIKPRTACLRKLRGLILVPEIEVNIYGKNDLDTGSGSGLSDIEAGLRLRYEVRREFAPILE